MKSKSTNPLHIRRSTRLDESSNAHQNGTEELSGQTVSSQTNESSNIQSSLLGLSPELRLEIYQHLVVDERPFLIGRCEEDKSGNTLGGPRDFYPGKHKVQRDDRPHRPIQPPITRVCRIIRQESLPIFYQENQFWLIHNKFSPDENDETEKQPRRFDPWIDQTPSKMFNLMQHVSLCGYTDWPTRIMITLDLKSRKLTALKEYSTYGDRLEVYEGTPRNIEDALESSLEKDGLSALEAVMGKVEWLFVLPQEHVSAPPGLSRLRKPMEGPEYDW